MRLHLLAVVLAVILFGGAFYLYRSVSPNEEQLPISLPSNDTSQASPDSSAQSQDNTSTATNYEECIAEGNQPLPDAPDKCLTKDGHLFIEGVVE